MFLMCLVIKLFKKISRNKTFSKFSQSSKLKLKKKKTIIKLDNTI